MLHSVYWISILLPLLIAFFLFAHFSFREFKPYSYKQTFLIITNVVVFGYVGARINHVIQYDMLFIDNINSIKDFIHSFFYNAGYKMPMGYTGALIGVIVVRVYFATLQSYLQALDKFVLFATFVSVFGNIGCFFDGHFGCRGTQTNLPWGCFYTFTKLTSNVPLHPMQLYTVFLMAVLFVWQLLSKQKTTGTKFFASMFVVMVYNIIIDSIRERFALLGIISFCQIIYFCNCIILGVMFYKFKKILKSN